MNEEEFAAMIQNHHMPVRWKRATSTQPIEDVMTAYLSGFYSESELDALMLDVNFGKQSFSRRYMEC